MFTVSEVAEILNISRQAVHKKIKTMSTDFERFTFKEGNILKISDEGLVMLRSKPSLNKVDSQLYRDKLIIALENQVNQLTKTLEDEKEEKNRLYLLLSQEKQEKQLLLESAAAKETKKGFWSILFGGKNV